MPTILQFRRGSTAQNDSFTGAAGELSIDTEKDTLRLHDGSTQGGFEITSATATQTLTNKTLSSPTFNGTITGSLIPSANVTYDLGSSTAAWNNLYLAGNTIFIGDATISYDPSTGFQFLDETGNTATVALTTDDVTEGTNLYYTTARANTDIDARVTQGFVENLSISYTSLSDIPDLSDPTISVTLSGDVSGSGSATLTDLANGSISITTTISDDSHNHTVSTITDYGSATNTAIDARVTKSFVEGLTISHTSLTDVPDPVITLGGDLTGSVTLTNLANGTLTATVVDNSHSHTVSNISDFTSGANSAIDARVTQSFVNALNVTAAGVQADSVALGTDTTGNYVATVSSGNGLTGSGSGEGSTPTLAVSAGNGLVANATGVHIVTSGDSSLTANSTGLFIEDSTLSIATSQLTGDIALGTQTSGNYVATASGGTGVTVTGGTGEGSTPSIAIGQDVATTANVTFQNGIFTGSLEVDGDLTISGNVVTISATELAIEDNMIYMNANSTTTNPDLGWAGNYNDGTYAHAGFFRDATDGVFKAYDGYTLEPDASPFIDTGHASFSLADIQANNFIGTLNGTANNATNLNGQAASYYLDWTNVTNKPDPVITLGGDLSGSVTLTNLANGTLTATVSDNSHNHTVSNISDFTTGANTAIDNRVTKSFIDALNVDADTLDGNDSTYFTNASNISSGTLASARLPDLVVGDFAAAAIQTGAEGFTDSDSVLMTAAAVQDKIESYGYSTTTGTVTSVGGTGTVNGLTLSGTVTSSGNLTLGGSLSGITVSQLAGAAVQTSAEGFSDSDTVLMTAAAIQDKIQSFGYSTTTGTVTSVATGGGLTGGTITGTGTISHADTSSQASVNNSGATVIQDVTLDDYGHVTGLASVTLTAASVGALGVSAKAADSNLLDGLDSSYFLNYNNLNNTPSAGGGGDAQTLALIG